MKILIGADLVPTQSNTDLFCAGDASALVGEELLAILRDADYRIFNLEVPLTDTVSPIDKYGPALIAPAATVAGYKALGVDLLTIANNHIMDQGEQGFRSTIETLDKNNIAHVGGGKNLEEAQRPYIIAADGKKIGVYACAEHEFSIAEENVPGANPVDLLESPDHVAALKARCDYVIVLYHGGKEHYRYPSLNLQKVCRKLVQKGADLVVCQHSHCIGCEEKYLHGTIVYGQGNFLFDHSQSEFWQTSLLIYFEDGAVSYLPVVKAGNGVRLADPQTARDIRAAFMGRSREIQQPGFIQEKYKAFAASMIDHYLLSVSGINHRSFVFRAVNKLTGGRWSKWCLKRKYSKAKRLAIRNYVECEAHRELFWIGVYASIKTVQHMKSEKPYGGR